jgi:hypothetical protein
MPLTKIEDHAEQAEGLLLSQYKGKPRIKALLLSYIRRVQELEDAAFDLLVARLIDEATGYLLEVIGRIVGQANEGSWDDDTYRIFIKARIRVNQSNGHGDDIIDVLNLVETADFILSEVYPAAMYVDFEEPTTVDPVILISLARGAKGAGVRLQLLYGDYEIGIDAFSFCTGTTEVASTTEGFALSDSSTGGYLSGVVE